MLLIMFFEIVFICCCHADPNGFCICYACYPWWASQILLKFGWNEPFCNRNKPWKFQLSIISDLEFICHWILCNFPIFGWSWANNKFMPNLSDNYIYSLEFCSAKNCVLQEFSTQIKHFWDQFWQILKGFRVTDTQNWHKLDF